MLKFMIFSEGNLLNTLVIDDPVVTIGRLAENTIPLAGTGVSRRHLRIEEDYDGSYFLSDLHSLNGTIVNGKQVRKIPLHAGDIIVVGTYSIIFEEVPKKDDFLAAAGAPAGKFPLTGSSLETALVTSRSPATGATASAPPASDSEDDVPVLLEMAKNLAFRLDKNFMTLGNDPADDIPVSGFLIGHRQAFLRLDNDGWLIGTQKALGMLKVNGRAVKTHLLRNKDHIEIGSITFRFMENG
jgi:pSer/pThr/pTyr-binding forkhead associated (FHA) protein